MREKLLQRLPVQIRFPARGSLAHLAPQHTTANLRPLLHVRKHPSLAVRRSNNWSKDQQSEHQTTSDHLGVTFISLKNIPPKNDTFSDRCLHSVVPIPERGKIVAFVTDRRQAIKSCISVSAVPRWKSKFE